MLTEAADKIRAQPLSPGLQSNGTEKSRKNDEEVHRTSTTLSAVSLYDSSEDNFSDLTSNQAGPLHLDGFGR